MNYTKENVHINYIRVGDCVEHEGKIRTVGGNNLKLWELLFLVTPTAWGPFQ